MPVSSRLSGHGDHGPHLAPGGHRQPGDVVLLRGAEQFVTAGRSPRWKLRTKREISSGVVYFEARLWYPSAVRRKVFAPIRTSQSAAEAANESPSAIMVRSVRTGVISEEFRAVGEPLMPSDEGKCDRRFGDHQLILEGIVWRFRTGSPWRDLPADFGLWQRCGSAITAVRWMETYDEMLRRATAMLGANERMNEQHQAPVTIRLSAGQGGDNPQLVPLLDAYTAARNEHDGSRCHLRLGRRLCELASKHPNPITFPANQTHTSRTH